MGRLLCHSFLQKKERRRSSICFFLFYLCLRPVFAFIYQRLTCHLLLSVSYHHILALFAVLLKSNGIRSIRSITYIIVLCNLYLILSFFISQPPYCGSPACIISSLFVKGLSICHHLFLGFCNSI